MTSGIQFDPEAIRKLAEILRETDLTEIEISEKEARIRVARILPAVTVAAPVMQAAAPMAAPIAGTPVAAAPATDPSALDLKNPDALAALKHHYLDRDRTLVRMLPLIKPPAPAARDTDTGA